MSRKLPSSRPILSMERVNASETHESSVPANRFLPTVSAALLVGIGYYVGTRIGFAWTPSGQPISTFWPPNAIVLAALLLAPQRTWWTILLAVLPVHIFAQLQTGVPVWTAVGWFISNSSEALIGAYCITKFADSAKRLDGVRGVLIFVIFGVLFAPLATSFLDAAAVVITGWGRDYWHLGLERFWTNALAELTVVPIIVLCRSKDISWIRRVNMARWGEAALLTLGTVVVAFLVFGLQDVSPASTPALLYVPLPFLLWAAARFGLCGLSLSLLSLALTSTWFTMHGHEPFPYASLPQNILSLQILFCGVAVPLMFLSAVMAEARRTQESLRRISSSLIEAQEQERHRIARDLHDDLGQELALVNVMLDKLREKSDASLDPALSDLSSRILAISETTRELSHGLYPTQLEYLGLQKAVRKLCDEVERGKEISLHLSIGNLPDKLQPSTLLSLYRVAQETLHNIITHSQAKNVKVVASDHGQILLRIIDDGVGFDVSQEGAGLGLTSMRQRVQALGGSIDISSSPRAGTQIEVRVPFGEHCSANVPGAA
ncbi:MAG TPA: MASE1 domain-containing protein [Terriglobales bacterium]|nr:MASE1 domain-containing protein [Terriglobales bacterium]